MKWNKKLKIVLWQDNLSFQLLAFLQTFEQLITSD